MEILGEELEVRNEEEVHRLDVANVIGPTPKKDEKRNDNQQLNFRNAVGGGVGRTLIKSKTSELSLLGGATFNLERFRIKEAADKSPRVWGGEGLVGLEWESPLRSCPGFESIPHFQSILT